MLNSCREYSQPSKCLFPALFEELSSHSIPFREESLFRRSLCSGGVLVVTQRSHISSASASEECEIYTASSALFALNFKVYTRAQWSVGFSAARMNPWHTGRSLSHGRIPWWRLVRTQTGSLRLKLFFRILYTWLATCWKNRRYWINGHWFGL